MSSPRGYEPLLASKGVPLVELGLAEVGLKRPDALEMIHALRDMSIPILGGDVYIQRGEKIELAYANWYVDRVPSESQLDFVDRSCQRAEGYIQAFPDLVDGEPLFVLVFPH